MGQTLLNEIQRGNRTALVKQRIITHLIYSGGMTITDLSKDMDLSVPTITKFIDEMCDEGYVVDCGKVETNGGRHPSLYGLNAKSGYFGGVEIKRDSVSIGVINFKGDVVHMEENIPLVREDSLTYLDKLCQKIKAFIGNLDIDISKMLNINFSIAGRVNPETGRCYGIFDFGGTPITRLLTERLNIDTSIDNDSRCMAYAEYIQGVVRGQKNLLFINVSWGLGMAIIIDGKLYRGTSGFAGEFGHNPGYDNQYICHCGKKGCIETEVSCMALYRNFIERLNNGENSVLLSRMNAEDIKIEDIIKAVIDGDVLSIELVEEIGAKLGRHIGGLINIFNPEMVVLGGDLSQVGDYLLQPVMAAIRKYTLTLMYRDSDIVISELKEKANILGTCLLSRSKLFAID